jgi:hypothetical protein
MVQFLFTNILLLSFGFALFVIIRALPRIEPDVNDKKPSVFERWLISDLPEKIDRVVNSFLEKFLRKTRVALLRFDNSINSWLKRIRPSGASRNLGFEDVLAMDKEVVRVEE